MKPLLNLVAIGSNVTLILLFKVRLNHMLFANGYYPQLLTFFGKLVDKWRRMLSQVSHGTMGFTHTHTNTHTHTHVDLRRVRISIMSVVKFLHLLLNNNY